MYVEINIGWRDLPDFSKLLTLVKLMFVFFLSFLNGKKKEKEKRKGQNSEKEKLNKIQAKHYFRCSYIERKRERGKREGWRRRERLRGGTG